uniref:Uncharacterized protein n=1 Tax=Anguilla anguilla TaxID=7936 RepID=A0A0E9S1Y4_ANGAN
MLPIALHKPPLSELPLFQAH